MAEATQYRVTVLPRSGGTWSTYNRGGIAFPVNEETILDAGQVNDAIRNDAYLRVEPVDGEAGDGLEQKTKAELVTIAEGLGIEKPTSVNKAELVEMIRTKQEEAPAE